MRYDSAYLTRYLDALVSLCQQRNSGLIGPWVSGPRHPAARIALRYAGGGGGCPVVWARSDVALVQGTHGVYHTRYARWGINDRTTQYVFRKGRVDGLGSLDDLLGCAQGYADLALAMLNPTNPDTYDPALGFGWRTASV